MTGGLGVPALALLGVLLVPVGLGVWWQRRQGVVRTGARRRVPGTRAARVGGADEGDAPFDWAAHGVDLGARRTFLQLSAAVCAPCRSTARVLAEVAGSHDGVLHRELDVDDHLDLVLAFGILRTPTVLVLDADGRETARASGAMNRRQAITALAAGDPTPVARTG
ncbi:thioredoxin family protein [Cellulosimicrobium sp. Marseille-Q4280]|uniref:thioredoxin family protein n=1 Tax=Cellulosimicrobium sp. Marseille-Q4280 TaxID=2937992 RepID=UPI00203CC571|nr:thioredoxin family protein [Cellulosimicrobium sp. Marseille-Q4280]